MLWLKTYTDRIQALVNQGTPHSLTYAALECRLAIERVCYERLQVAHDYISHADLKKWQPRQVVNTLIQEVDADIASSFTLSMSKTPDGHDYVEVGRQVGFDPAKIGKLWNALGSFLHVCVPKSKTDPVASYGEDDAIRSKVEEVLAELRQLEQGTLISSGLGENVSFVCYCETKNTRRAALLREGQVISCINPECREKWKVCFEGTSISFQWRKISVTCYSCSHVLDFPEWQPLSLKRGQSLKFVCQPCEAENYVVWKLMHVKLADPAQSSQVPQVAAGMR